MKKILSPILYIFSTILVFFVTLFLINIIEKTLGFHTIWRTGDIDVFIVLIFSGAVIFGLISRFLLNFEMMKCPTIIDHMRYSGLLYIPFFVLFVEYMRASVYTSNGLSAVIYTAILGTLFIGIIVNAATLFIIARKKQ